MNNLPKINLSVYLIKDRYKTFNEVLNNDNLNEVALDDLRGIFYYANSKAKPPGWMDKFFGNALNNVSDIFNAQANGLILAFVECDGHYRIFAVAFGSGRNLLKNNVIEERFGLKVVLNIIDSASLKKIDKKRLSSVPKDTTEQLTKAGNAYDFGINIEEDLIRSITGRSNNLNFGLTVTGKDGLNVTAPVNLTNLERFLTRCYSSYTDTAYKSEFGWIDHISEVKDKVLINELDKEALKNIERHDPKTWMAVPEIIDWANLQGFTFPGSKNQKFEDVNLGNFLSTLSASDQKNLDVDLLLEMPIIGVDTNDREKYKWSVYECLYSEVRKNDHTYLLSNKKWYQIDKEFAEKINDDFKQTLQESNYSLPDYHHGGENEYNKDVGALIGIHCVDKSLIVHGGGPSRIEFCDLYTADGDMIYVKKYSGSAVLSHLFNQGLVGGELLLGDTEFREKLNKILPAEVQLKDPTNQPRPENHKIIYGIITKSKKDLDIPFFSIVSFRVAKRRLNTFGFRVEIAKIAMNAKMHQPAEKVLASVAH